MSKKGADVLAILFFVILWIAGTSIIYAMSGFVDGAIYLALLAIFGMKILDFFSRNGRVTTKVECTCDVGSCKLHDAEAYGSNG